MSGTGRALTDSPTPWLGRIPQDWRVGRLDHVAAAWTSNVDKHSIEGQPTVRLCNYTDVYKNDTIHHSMDFMLATATEEQIERFRLRRGDILITKDSETANDIGIPAYVDYEADDLICGYHLAMIRPRLDAVHPRFLFWAMAAQPTCGQWAVLASGVTRVGIRSADLAKVTLALPPVREQRAIADYLDRETARIDTLVEEQQRLIELLYERRRAVVDGAFAPDRYTTTRLRRMLRDRPTYGVLVPDYVDGKVFDSVPFIRVGNITAGGVSAVERWIGSGQSQEYSRTILRPGDVLLGVVGRMGSAAVVPSWAAGFNVARAIAVLRPHPSIHPELLAAWFTSSQFLSQASQATASDTVQPTLGMSDLAEFSISWPSEPDAADQLAMRTARIDALIAETERFIELSRERRAALITAAVTGQIDVRGEAG
jgi:type I restriction enzyme S subunit